MLQTPLRARGCYRLPAALGRAGAFDRQPVESSAALRRKAPALIEVLAQGHLWLEQLPRGLMPGALSSH